ncbi:MAG: acyltransferase [Puniceicoccales bacterium]|jgi:peptidoglycan/LPS O-acetylase OafA/YrhL|nr:acyltransferase [Puniceicoccales bacterium]
MSAPQPGTSSAPAPSDASSAGFLANNFDLVRLFAALQTVLEHGVFYILLCRHDWHGLPLPLRHLLDFHGVAIFFVISGYLVSASWERAGSVLAYARNRVLRIYPALWMCLLLSVIVVFALRVPVSAGELLKWLAAQATFLQCFNPDFFRERGVGLLSPGKGVINGALWTITVELQFYIVFPVLHALLKMIWNGRAPGRLASIAATIAFGFLGWLSVRHGGRLFPENFNHLPYLNLTFIPHFYLFLFGWALRKNFDWLAPILRGKALFWIGGLCLLVLMRGTFGFPYPRGVMIYPSIQYLLLGLAAVSCAHTAPSLAKKILRGNDISYGIYIYHMLVLSLFMELGLYGWFLATGYKNLALFVLVTLLAAVLSWFLVERPALRLKRRVPRLFARGGAFNRPPP